MKSAFTVFVLIGFVGIAVFGFAAMGHGDDHGRCIAAAVKGMDCPEWGNIFSFANFHFDFFRSFSTAVFTDGIGAFFSFLFFLAFWWFGVIPKFQFGLSFSRPSAAYQFLDSLSVADRQQSRWLALHENSPAFFLWRR